MHKRVTMQVRTGGLDLKEDDIGGTGATDILSLFLELIPQCGSMWIHMDLRQVYGST